MPFHASTARVLAVIGSSFITGAVSYSVPMPLRTDHLPSATSARNTFNALFDNLSCFGPYPPPPDYWEPAPSDDCSRAVSWIMIYLRRREPCWGDPSNEPLTVVKTYGKCTIAITTNPEEIPNPTCTVDIDDVIDASRVILSACENEADRTTLGETGFEDVAAKSWVGVRMGWHSNGESDPEGVNGAVVNPKNWDVPHSKHCGERKVGGKNNWIPMKLHHGLN